MDSWIEETKEAVMVMKESAACCMKAIGRMLKGVLFVADRAATVQWFLLYLPSMRQGSQGVGMQRGNQPAPETGDLSRR